MMRGGARHEKKAESHSSQNAGRQGFCHIVSPFVGSLGQSESGARAANGQSIQRLLNGNTTGADRRSR
ncbi:hypothetical protein EMEDMD4_70165 [Sinorhizobium medicae]|uniref:Uncharacterized protein n=1 Tax=Sinorhizobium medicae TaxID=110321 RepID=A0A508X4W2_9HYPH|nr:hypothetical protein EMEDMD4_70165 [Sinorhizobium medicae]